MSSEALSPAYSPTARLGVRALRPSLIREVANAAIGREGVLPFYFGEPDQPTPQRVRDFAAAELAAGNTFYTQTMGLPSLREAIAGYVQNLHGSCDADRVVVTSSGTAALMTAIDAVVGFGDRVVAVTPLWPNLVETPKVIGANVESVPLDFSAEGWTLDVDKLIDVLTPGTVALLLNSPNNPTGWAISAEHQQIILDHCRRHGIWIIADDVYERYYFDGRCAPSFLDIAHEDDRVISSNSFSKTWLMTGWRIGWLVAPKELVPQLGKVIEFSTSCSPGFVQAAAKYALETGEETIEQTVSRLKVSRDHLGAALATVPGVTLGAPAQGAMYTFFKMEGVTDSLDYCMTMIEESGLGLAPGIAFGPEGEGYLRWCFASDTARIDEGIERFRAYTQKTIR